MAGITTPSSSIGGYDYQFVETPGDTLICTICHLPSKEPHLSVCCGHVFCKSCAEASKKVNVACPMCQSETFSMFPNKQAERLIQNLKIFCTNKEQGCDWQGDLNNITNHLSSCLFQVVCCPNDCGSSLQRQYLTSHVEAECLRRKIDCQFCHEVGEYQFIEGKHKEECPKFPLPCPNKCEIEDIQRDKVDEHRKSCPLEVIQCDYHVIGCTAKMIRKELSKHKSEMMEEHLSLSVKMKSSDSESMLAALQDTKGELSEKFCHISKELAVISQDLATTKEQMAANQLDAMKAKDEMLKKLTTTEKDLSNARKSIQSLTKLEKELERSFTEIKDNLTKITRNSATKTKELESKLDEKTNELKTKVDQVGKLLYDATVFCSNTLNHQASKLYLYDQANAASVVVVKMPGFSKNKKEWCTSQFYLKPLENLRMRLHQNSYQTQFKVTTSQDDQISVAVVMPEMQRKVKQASEMLVVKLLNQLSDGEHFTAKIKSASQPTDFQYLFNKRLTYSGYGSHSTDEDDDDQLQFLIPYGELSKKTPTCEFLRNDIAFFEVSMVGQK